MSPPTDTEIDVSGLGDSSLGERLRLSLTGIRPKVIGCASAFVSNAGVNELIRIAKNSGVKEGRLIAGISHYITHPEALNTAIDAGWDLRLGTGTNGIFHPKIVMGGSAFSRTGDIDAASFVYVGSGNLTHAGLHRNVECGLLSTETYCSELGSLAFGKLWRHSKAPNAGFLDEYAEKFAERNRHRSVEELKSLGIYDAEDELTRTYAGLLQSRPPRTRTISSKAARAAWAGVESFTGDYMFQLEFPRDAGEVIAALIRSRGSSLGKVPVLCLGDGEIRDMQFSYYRHNSMYRLNIPNEVPGVVEARASRKGIVLVSATSRKDAVIELHMIAPGSVQEQVIGRSFALGTWSKTTTRAYGWF